MCPLGPAEMLLFSAFTPTALGRLGDSSAEKQNKAARSQIVVLVWFSFGLVFFSVSFWNSSSQVGDLLKLWYGSALPSIFRSHCTGKEAENQSLCKCASNKTYLEIHDRRGGTGMKRERLLGAAVTCPGTRSRLLSSRGCFGAACASGLRSKSPPRASTNRQLETRAILTQTPALLATGQCN